MIASKHLLPAGAFSVLAKGSTILAMVFLYKGRKKFRVAVFQTPHPEIF
jgi:hypothetical protein